MCCCLAVRIECADGCSQGTHKSFNDGKCCRATVAVSTADSGSPSMMKPSKLSAINIATASETLRTMRVSVQFVRSKIDSNRSSKTGSGFKIRTRVSTENTGNCSLQSRNPAFLASAAVVNAPKPASAAVQETRPVPPRAQCGNEFCRLGKAFAAHVFRQSQLRCLLFHLRLRGQASAQSPSLCAPTK